MEAVLPPSVLFVDDDRSMRIAFANGARALGIEAVVAESGGEALELAQQSRFPVIVTDLRMPGIDGIALIERLSALDPACAFILVSGDPELKAGMSGGADGAISSLLGKPLDLNEFRETLARAYTLHKRRVARESRAAPSLDWSLLIVEDSPGDAQLLQEYLVELPTLTIVHVTRLQEALRVLHDREFDSIITDLSLPDARGFDAVLRLQASAPGAALLVHSGVEDESLALQVVQLGAQDFLPKRSTDQSTLLRALRFARERKRAELRLRRLAHYDQLTGLANRASFNDALTQAVARAQRQHQLLAVMMIDLDGFKEVNDVLGHGAGDQVLQEVGVRLRCLFREYDVVARLGGDEFAVLLADFESKAALSLIAERLLESLALPVGELGQRVTASVGIAMFQEDGMSHGRFVRAADLAMYAAKRGGRNRYVFFDGPVPLSSNPTAPLTNPPSTRGPALAPARLPTEFMSHEAEAANAPTEKEMDLL